LRPIDAHVHVFTGDRGRYPRAVERDARPERFTPEDFFAHAKPSGVARAVLIQISFYRFDNSYMLHTMRAHPGVFSGVAVVDPASRRPEEAMKALARQGVRGFRITPGGSPGAWLDAPGMQAMWRGGAEQGLAMCPLVNPDALPSIDRMCARHPETPVVIDHLARIGAGGEIRDSDTRLLCGLARHPNVKVKVSAFYALGRKTPPYTDLAPLIARVFENFGPRRLMWASDSPFQVQDPHTYEASISLVRKLPFLSAEDREWLLEKTAASVFFTAARSGQAGTR
jgi:predicted TIM-barrel fold metal-dependent hydrolase